jgi:UDP-N-acetylglucosamine 4-epimerase
MSLVYTNLKAKLFNKTHQWLVTGAAGFIGSHLLETLLKLNQRVVGIDNFSTGSKRNLEEVRALVGPSQWQNFVFVEGDIRDFSLCRRVCEGIDFVLHQAALGSVPRSIHDPIATHQSNVDGFLNMLVAAKEEKVKRFVYAASSSTYGDHPALPKVEENIGKPLSPYAASKLINEIYADVFAKTYGFQSIGLRYFNVFGPRQDPDGPYAAVIPKWFSAIIKGQPIIINGDGETSRDFCYVANAVQANLLAAMMEDDTALNQVYNVAVGESTTLNQLFGLIQRLLMPECAYAAGCKPTYTDFRVGDVRHSLASIEKASQKLSYQATHKILDGLTEAKEWYLLRNLSQKGMNS